LRQLNGTPVNCKKAVLGRIATGYTKSKNRGASILVAPSPSTDCRGYRAVLTERQSIETSIASIGIPVFSGVARISELNAGDVVRLGPSGSIDVLYERLAPHNALFVTEQCNCSCLICPQHTTKTRSDYTDQVLELVKLVDPETKTLGITGGEPTLLGENFLKVVKCCKDILPGTALQVLSNGIRFSDFDFTKSLATIGHPCLQIGIPLYADTDSEHDNMTQVSGFHKTVKGIYNLALFRQRVEIRTVINALNYKRLPRLAEFIYRNFPFVVHVAFMGMETRELARKNINLLWVDPHDYGKYLDEAVDILSLRGMSVSIYNHQLCVLPTNLWPFARKSISTWKNIYLPECRSCKEQNQCGGFFTSSVDIHSRYIHPLSG